MLSKKMTAAFNGQVAAELYSSYLYISMSAWLQSEGFPGAANWMGLQAREEVYHAQKLYNHILERGGQVKLGAIEAPPFKWKTPLEVFEQAYAHEQKVTGLINNLMSMAKAESDHASEIFLQWFVTEQVEEEATALDVVQKFKLAAGGAGFFMIDQELGARVLSQIVKDALTGTVASSN
ncbi:ferritin [Deltaproteobacteria bacterium Smac51]|nr:ferritin [Deltaproteobacteria bacterium Smac51]